MHNLIKDVFAAAFDNDLLMPLEDQARVPLSQLVDKGDRLAFTTDSYVVDPLIFPGGDIGSLAVHGTVNDLAVGGAIPLYLTCSVIIEEGMTLDELRYIVGSMSDAARGAQVSIITGDTKVVPRGACDKLFINTAGVGVIPENVQVGAHRACPGDVLLLNGCIGNHGAAILNARGDLALESSIESDSAPLHDLVQRLLAVCPDIHCMRDATRGGVATVLNEFAQHSGCCLRIEEASLPVRDDVRGMCEILGLDPLYMANEGKLLLIAPARHRDILLEVMRGHELGRDAVAFGEVVAQPAGMVVLQTAFGGERVLDMQVGEQLPRIC